MEIDLHNHKELIAEIVQTFKDVKTEFAAFKLSVLALDSQCSDLEQRLEAAVKNSSQLQRATQEKYDVLLERFLEQCGEGTSDWVVLRRLQALNASGTVN
jgi:hypothetical protein